MKFKKFFKKDKDIPSIKSFLKGNNSNKIKLPISDILNKEIIIESFEEKLSKFQKNDNEKIFATIIYYHFTNNDKEYFTYTNSFVLKKALIEVNDNLPLKAIICKNGNNYYFK